MTRHIVITVSIADGNTQFTQALAQSLARCPGVVIFDRCHDQESTRSALSERPPRVLFVGDSIPDTQGWQWLESLPRRTSLPTQLVALSESQEGSQVQAALRSGAVGYLLRSSPLLAIHQALHDVCNGGSPLSPTAARSLVTSLCAPRTSQGALSMLTERESEVLELLSRGMRYREIAQRMSLSADTVHSHTKNVYRKLNVSSKTEAAMIWLRSLGSASSSVGASLMMAAS